MVVVVSALAAAPAGAQDARHLFGGVGGAFIVDQAPRLVMGGLAAGGRSRAIVVDGGVFVAPRLAVGFELIHPTAVTTSTSGLFGTITGAERELTFAGVARVAVVRAARWTVDLAGGIGQLSASIDTVVAPRDARGASTTTSARNLLVIPIGVDVAFETGAHLAFGPMVRVYWLRGERPAAVFPGQTLGLLDQPTTRIVFGATVRGFW